MRFSEVVDSIESAMDFIHTNKIIPKEIILVWEEDLEDKEKRNFTEDLGNKPMEDTTELKTLKDLDCLDCDEIYIDKNELKAEAVKRVKDILNKTGIKIESIEKNNVKWDTKESKIDDDMQRGYFMGMMFEDIDFFNLTEEDLK